MPGILDFLADARTLNAIGSGLQAGGQVAGGIAQIMQGSQQRAAADFTAGQLRERAGQEQAAAQRDAFFEERKARILASNALAAAAASGGGASDPTVINIIAGIAQEGAYRKAVALYGGDDRARALQLQAQAAEFEGKSRQAAGRAGALGSFLGATTTLAKSVARDASMYQRFGAGGPRLPKGFEGMED